MILRKLEVAFPGNLHVTGSVEMQVIGKLKRRR
jgi:hypothetical protein